jgi:peptidyl-prolyl cis-trans isomerase B (cyclophilin B)
MKLKSIIISGPDKFYTIGYANSEENFDSKLNLFDESLNSFTILSNETSLQTNNETQNNGGGCLIATTAFGTELAPQIQLLREIRDNTILGTHSGAAFMSVFNSFYYSFSPTIADLERQNPVFKEAVKIAIMPLISTLGILQHVDIDSEAEMIGYGIGIILLNIGMYFVAPAFVLLKLNSKYQDEKNKI